jgi:hypothetical protein
MTLKTAMTMNCRGSLNRMGHSPEMDDGREHGEHKCDKVRCRSGTQDASFFPNISCCSSGCYPARLWKACILGAPPLEAAMPLCDTSFLISGLPRGSSPGRTGRPSCAERFAASARALSSRAARTFSGSVLPAEERSTHRPKGEPPSADTRAVLHRSAPRRRVLRPPGSLR